MQKTEHPEDVYKRQGMRVGAVEDVFSLSMSEEKKELADFYIRDYRELIQGAR